MSIENIKVPDLGDASEVEVIELLVSVGQSVEENDSLLVLESDKAAMEIPAPMAGVVKSISVNLGDQVSTGSEMLSLEVDGGGSDESESSDDAEDSSSEESEPEKESEKESEKDSESEKESEKESKSQKDSESEKESESAEDSEPAEEKDDTASKKSKATDSDSSTSKQSSQTLEVPDLGTDDEIEIIEIHIKEKDSVEVDDVLITLESDKAAMDVPASHAGVIESLLVAVGDKVKTGSAIAKILADAPAAKEETAEADADKDDDKAEPEQAKSEPAAKAQPQEEKASPAAAEPAASSESSNKKVYAGPAVRKLARELGVDLTQVKGSGAKSRIIKEDVQDFVKNKINAPSSQGPAVSAIPDIDFGKFGEVEQVSRSKLHKLTAINMQRSWNSVPHVAQFNEIDVTDLEEFRAELKGEAERRDVKLTFLPFLLKACAKALVEYPQFNVSLHSSGEYVIQKKYVHIGMAVATEAGLVVPVIRDVDKKTIWQLAQDVIELSDKAKNRKLKTEDMQGACFTISSLGAIGGTGFIPIVNAPEVAILGVAKTDIKPVYIGGEFVPRKVLPITLSYDHKAVNGVDGGLFATYLGKLLGDVRHLAL